MEHINPIRNAAKGEAENLGHRACTTCAIHSSSLAEIGKYFWLTTHMKYNFYPYYYYLSISVMPISNAQSSTCYQPKYHEEEEEECTIPHQMVHHGQMLLDWKKGRRIDL